MRKPLSEYETTLTARKHRAHPAPDPDAAMEGVRGGRVRRIVFEEDDPAEQPQQDAEPLPEPEPEPPRMLRYQEVHERHFTPRHRGDIASIERDVDRIIGRAAAPPPASRTIRRERTIYETPSGEVSEEIRETREGKSRALYTSRREGEITRERRFSAADVDRILAERPPREEVIRETYRERVREVPAKEHERPKARQTAKKRRRSRRKERSKPAQPAPIKAQPVEESAPEAAYQPQCGAVTANGKQCRNSAKHASKYCGAHQGYTPLTMKQIMTRQDTAPTVDQAADTLPTEGTRSTKKGYQAQCAALTADGKQCKNSSRDGSKYCGSHRNYRPQSIASKMDTKPRVKKAEDTKPTVKKPRASTSRRTASKGKTAGASRTAKRGRKATRKTAKAGARKTSARAPKTAGKGAKKASKKTAKKSSKKTTKAVKRGKAAKKSNKKATGARKRAR